MYDDIESIRLEDWSQAVADLEEGHGWLLDKWETPNFCKAWSVGPKTLARLNSERRFTQVICHGGRPIVAEFSRRLEFEFYAPMTPRNDLFKTLHLKWEGMFWIVIIIPTQDEKFARQVAIGMDCRLADGFPHVITLANGANCLCAVRGTRSELMGSKVISIKRFPLSSIRAFTLEPEHKNQTAVLSGIAIQDPPVPTKAAEPPSVVDDLIAAFRRQQTQRRR